MKWYKHLSGSLNNSFVFELIERFGGDGYLVFFGTLELMADEFDIKNPGISTFSIKKLTKNLQLSRQKAIKILKFCDEKKRIFINIQGDNLTLDCPRLKELTDEYTQKQLSKMSGQTPDSNRDKLRPKEAEAEAEAEVKPIKRESKKTDSRIKVFIDWYFKMYEMKFKRKYAIPNGAKIGNQVKNILKSGLSFSDIQLAAMCFMLDEDEFLIGNEEKTGAGYDIGIFLTRMNKYNFAQERDNLKMNKWLVNEKGEKLDDLSRKV